MNARTVNAFTIGNPEAYEQLHGTEACKLRGGVVFQTREEAQRLLDQNGGNLPQSLLDTTQKTPGRVYGLVLPRGFKEDTEDYPEHYPLRRLRIEARIVPLTDLRISRERSGVVIQGEEVQKLLDVLERNACRIRWSGETVTADRDLGIS